MKGTDKVRRWLRRVGASRRPWEHLSDAELLDALERARRGEDTSDVPPYPGDPSTWPATGLEHLSDEELMTELWGPREGWPPHVEDAVRRRCLG